MDELLGVLGNVTRVLAILGGGVAAVTVCFAGIQFMTGAGDPQKMSQARMSLIGTVGGLILVGVAFIIPRFVAETVTDPVGGVPIVEVGSNNCDQILRTQLVFQTAVSVDSEFIAVIEQIQGSRAECQADAWDPGIGSSTRDSGNRDRCFGTTGSDHQTGNARIGGQLLPPGLHDGGKPSGLVRGGSGRDAHNNILVYFFETSTTGLPNDRSVCWLYVSRLKTWLQNYER